MTHNTKTFNIEEHYGKKSTKELQQILKESEEFVDKYPQFKFGWHNEYRQKIKLLIAERIGKKA